jgi:hypothetical protein
VLAQADAFDRKHAEGFPPAAKQLGMLEAKAAKTGKSPQAFKKAPATQTARLLTVLVEFDPNANDDFSGFERPPAVGAEECVTEPPGTLLNGPVHNQLPDPATGGYAVPGAGVRVNNYIMQAEDAGAGVVSHEYGHDLGLPDLYDTSGVGWIITSGTFIYQHYHLAEWRNYDGFDKGLRYAYDTTYFARCAAPARRPRTTRRR